MSNSYTYPLLRPGDGYRDQRPELRAYVKSAQIALTEHGYPASIDGHFGPNMEDAVRMFQRAEGIDVDGIIGHDTWNRLNPQINSPAASPSKVPSKPENPSMTGDELAKILVSSPGAILEARRTRIVRVAESFLGQQEIPGNMGFRDSNFERLMRSVGWWQTAAWCDFFAELVWTTAYNDDLKTAAIIKRLMTGSTIRSFKAFKESGLFTITSYPSKGALAYWQFSRTTGHVGPVTDDGGATAYFHTIEGNTNDQGGREGYIVARRTHAKNDRKLLGFVQPITFSI